MTKTWNWSRGPRPYGLWLLAVVGGALASMLVLLLFYRLGGLRVVAPPVVLAGAELRLVVGRGESSPAGLEIRQPGPEGVAVAQGLVRRMVRAALYDRLSWRVHGLEPNRQLRLVWVTLAEPQKNRVLTLPPVGSDGIGILDLRTEPYWQGRIAALGLIVPGPFPQPPRLEWLELRPASLSFGDLLRWALEEWTSFEDWSQRSINYTAGAPLDALFPPVLVVALWIGVSGVLYALLDPSHRRKLMPYAALFLLGWLALDLRWQWDLRQRLEQTVKNFAGKTEEDRRLAALDGDLYRFLLEVRRRLPERPIRLFIVSADPYGFQAGRARYHLLPHNGYAGFSQVPNPGEARAGDYVLILSPLNGVGYNRGSQALEWQGGRLPAEMLHVAAAGALFRVRGG
ncbi:MAG: hypothetical protein P9E24_13270 [Candidatus Competibacter sp.]|nr:hypothetical protein [Candidatus Competibacter sp.]MDG4582724.1 hypothetical protein [Candidatus Competibacter sp.]